MCSSDLVNSTGGTGGNGAGVSFLSSSGPGQTLLYNSTGQGPTAAGSGAGAGGAGGNHETAGTSGSNGSYPSGKGTVSTGLGIAGQGAYAIRGTGKITIVTNQGIIGTTFAS